MEQSPRRPDRPLRPRHTVLARLWPAGLLALLLLAWMRPLLFSLHDYWLVHSTLTDPHRALGVVEAWRCGLWDARWFPGFDHGYGYPILSFYSPLFPWMSGAWLLAAGTPTLAIRLNLLVWLAFGTAGVYRAGERFWRVASEGRAAAFRPGLLCATGWLMSPYLMCDVFVRGALSEFAAAQTFPWILWAAFGVMGRSGPWTRRDGAELLIAVPAISAGILGHNFLGMVAAGFAAAMIPMALAVKRFGPDWPQAKRSLVFRSGVWTVGIAWALAATLFFWLPALREAKFTRLSVMTQGIYDFTYRYMDHFLLPANYLRVGYWDFGNSIRGPNDTMPLHLGWVSVLAAAVTMAAVAVMLLKKGKRTAIMAAGIAALVLATACSVLLTMPASRWLWERLPIAHFAQFPWRLLGLPTLGVCLLLPAAVAAADPARKRAGLAVMLGALAVCFAASHFLYGKIREAVPYGDDLTTKNWETKQVLAADLDEYGPIWRDRYRPPKWPRGALIESEKVKVGRVENRRVRLRADVENHADRPEPLVLTTNYFPGWQARTEPDNRPLTVTFGPATGFVLIENVPPGRSTIRIWFGNTPLRRTCKMVSAAAWLAWLAMGGVVGVVRIRR